jgi:hypothetical protein
LPSVVEEAVVAVPALVQASPMMTLPSRPTVIPPPGSVAASALSF